MVNQVHAVANPVPNTHSQRLGAGSGACRRRAASAQRTGQGEKQRHPELQGNNGARLGHCRQKRKKGPEWDPFSMSYRPLRICSSMFGAGNETGTRPISPCFPIIFFAEVFSKVHDYSLIFCPRQQGSSSNIHGGQLTPASPSSETSPSMPAAVTPHTPNWRRGPSQLLKSGTPLPPMATSFKIMRSGTCKRHPVNRPLLLLCLKAKLTQTHSAARVRITAVKAA